MGLFDWLRERNTRRNGREIAPAADQTSLGNLLVSAGHLSPEELGPLIEEFNITRNVDQLLGQFLVDRGVITKDELELALLRQRHLRHPASDALAQALEITSRRRGRLHDQAREVTQLAFKAVNGQEPIKNGSTH